MTLWRDDAVLARPVTAARQRHERRARLYVAIEHDDCVGYGEISPQPERLHGDPSLDEVCDELEHVTVPQLLDVVAREQRAPAWARFNRFAGPRSSSNAAVLLVEMALLDRELRAAHSEIRTLWPALYETPVQSTLSLLDPLDSWFVPPDVGRVRVKTAPGALTEQALERLGALGVALLLDYNCSGASAQEVRSQAERVGAVATLDAVEQPFSVGNLVEHAALARNLGVPVSMDEGVRSFADIHQIVRYQAAAMICVKPARVGGLANARTIIVRAREFGLRVYIGGFFESPYARFVHRALAEHCVSEPSDVGPVAVAGRDESIELDVVRGGFTVAPAAGVLARSEVIGRWG